MEENTKNREQILQDLWQDGYKTFAGYNKNDEELGTPKRWPDKAKLFDNESVDAPGYGVRPPEGHFILDFDSEEAHTEFLNRFERIPEVMNTFIVKSPKGWHYYYKGDIKKTIRPIGPLRKIDLFSHDSGFVWGPSSKRPSGKEYVIQKDLRVAQAPDDLMKWVQDQIT